jgi:hypothetical protein
VKKAPKSALAAGRRVEEPRKKVAFELKRMQEVNRVSNLQLYSS